MTLQNGLIHDRKGYLWTDTALWSAATGARIGHVEKAFMGLHWPWAGVLSGMFDTNDPHRVQTMIANAQPMTPQELLQASVKALQSEALAGRPGRLLICHACPDEGARLWFIAADETPIATPFVPEEVLQFTSSGNGSSEYARLDARGFTPARMRKFGRYQATTRTDTVLGWPQRLGGNHIELEVSAAGVEARQVGRFG